MKKAFLMQIIAAIVIGVLTSLSGIQGCRKSEDRLQKIVFADAVQPVSAPIYVALEKGFFGREGLEISLESFWAGKDALDSVINGGADFGTVAETPIMFAALQKKPIAVIATMADSSRYMTLVARKDRGIAGPRDLRGKKVGVVMGTNGQYFLDAYLTFNGIALEQVHPVAVNPDKMAGALATGWIDAAVSWMPHVAKQVKRLGANALILENRHIYQLHWNIVARQDYVRKQPETVEKLVRALVRAQQYIEEHPEEARAITGRAVGEEVLLPDFNFDIRLGQAQLLILEDQARWAIQRGLTDRKVVPNFLDLFYFEALQSVAPESVMIVHQ